jgi:hypothetical protein
MRSLLVIESFDWHPSNQYLLVRAIPSCFRLATMCLCQVSLLSRCSPRYLTSSVVNVMCVDLGPLAFILHFASQLCIASKLVCSLLEAIVGSLSVAITALLSAKVADLVSGQIGRSAVTSR